MTTINAIGNGLSGATGTGTFVGSNSPTVEMPTVNDTNGNHILLFNSVASAVNYFAISNNAMGSSPTLTATGSDANVTFVLFSKGGNVDIGDSTNTNGGAIAFLNAAGTQKTQLTISPSQATSVTFLLPAADGSANFIMKTNGSGQLSFTNGSQVAGTATNNDASSGNIGEIISSVIAFASATSLTTATAKDVTSISLTAGDWDVWANVFFNNTGTFTQASGWTSTTSATLPDLSLLNTIGAAGVGVGLSQTGFSVPTLRYSLASTTTIYLSAQASFASGAVTACGGIYARRRR